MTEDQKARIRAINEEVRLSWHRVAEARERQLSLFGTDASAEDQKEAYLACENTASEHRILQHRRSAIERQIAKED